MKTAVICFALSAALWPPAIVYAQHRTADEAFTMALTGDSLITRRLSVYDEPEYLRMIELIRSADVAFTNLEMVLHDYEPWLIASIEAPAVIERILEHLGRDAGSVDPAHPSRAPPERDTLL